MGFEQLAGLKEQLAKQAANNAAKKKAQRARRPTPAPAPASASKTQTASKQNAPKQNAPKPAASKQVAPSKPVDPVVHTIGKLQKRFPLAFPKNPAPKVPLKVGIFEDLMKHAEELGLDERELRSAIKVWCRGNRYWTCLVEGAPRIDLTGGHAGEVSKADAARAVHLETNRAARAASSPKPAEAAKPAGKESGNEGEGEASK
jgi:ProP effector